MMTSEHQLKRLVNQLEVMVETVSNDHTLVKPDVRRILKFINKVILVVDQAFQDVLNAFDDIRQLSEKNASTEYMNSIVDEVKLLLERDKYRNVEYICGRLATLKAMYNNEIKPLLKDSQYKVDEWRDVLWLIEDREGRIIMMVENLIWEVKANIDKYLDKKIDLNTLKNNANVCYQSVKLSLKELHELNNKIMGFSGDAGLLELTDIGEDIKKQTIIMKPKNNPWISGSFYLIAAVVILSLLLVAGNILSPIVFPIALIGGLIIFSIIGAYQLKNDDRLSDKSFIELMTLSFKQIPFIRSSNREKPS